MRAVDDLAVVVTSRPLRDGYDAAGGVVAPTFVRVEVARELRDRGGLVVEIGRVRVRVERGFDGVVLRELVEVLARESAP